MVYCLRFDCLDPTFWLAHCFCRPRFVRIKPSVGRWWSKLQLCVSFRRENSIFCAFLAWRLSRVARDYSQCDDEIERSVPAFSIHARILFSCCLSWRVSWTTLINKAIRKIPNTEAKPTKARAKVALGTTSPKPRVVMVTTSIHTVSFESLISWQTNVTEIVMHKKYIPGSRELRLEFF